MCCHRSSVVGPATEDSIKIPSPTASSSSAQTTDYSVEFGGQKHVIGLHDGPHNMALHFSLEEVQDYMKQWGEITGWQDLAHTDAAVDILYRMTFGVVRSPSADLLAQSLPENVTHSSA